MDYDVVVVGAGPAGATAARDLAHRGLSVGLVEQYLLPRYKPCGGCLSLKIDRILEPDFHPLVDRTIFAASFTYDGVDEVAVRSDRPLAYMVMRDRFDAFLVDKAARAGVHVHTGERVLTARESQPSVEVVTTRRAYTARYLVGADGANGVVARALRLHPDRRVAVCVEAEVTTAPRTPDPPGDAVRIEFGAIPFGYGWVFPKGDHLSVGVGGLRPMIGNPKALYEEFLVDQDLADSLVDERRRGYIIPVFAGGGTALGGRRTLLVGDAAALVDPFLGEGVYYAVRSGQLAARAIAEVEGDSGVSPLDDYARRVDAEIYRDFRPARRLALFLYAFRRPGYAILRERRAFIELFFLTLRGEATYGDLWRELHRFAAGDLVRTLWPSNRRPSSVGSHYDRLAKRYDVSLGLWRTLVVAPAWEALAGLLEAHVPDGARVLDGGTGTGEVVRLLLERTRPAEIVAVDLSRGMLHEARKKIAAPRVRWEQQDVTALPYPDCSFDIVVSTWTLETLADPRAAVREFLRVIRDDGFVIYAFSSRPAGGLRRLYGRLVDEWTAGTLQGRFLERAEQPFHTCPHSRLIRFAGGLATVVVLRKCCRVDNPTAACLPCVHAA